jgi:hypothetical protein
MLHLLAGASLMAGSGINMGWLYLVRLARLQIQRGRSMLIEDRADIRRSSGVQTSGQAPLVAGLIGHRGVGKAPFRRKAAFLGKTGAGGENRTLDLPLTKGLRYHYATPAFRWQTGPKRPGAEAIAQPDAEGKGS